MLLSSSSSPTNLPIPPLVRAELGFRLDLARLRSLPHMADIFGSHASLAWLACWITGLHIVHAQLIQQAEEDCYNKLDLSE